MAVLSDALRRKIWADFMRQNNETVTVQKADLRAAVDAIDAWLDANLAAINAAFPQPARANLSPSQKARILAFVALRRFSGDA